MVDLVPMLGQDWDSKRFIEPQKVEGMPGLLHGQGVPGFRVRGVLGAMKMKGTYPLLGKNHPRTWLGSHPFIRPINGSGKWLYLKGNYY